VIAAEQNENAITVFKNGARVVRPTQDDPAGKLRGASPMSGFLLRVLEQYSVELSHGAILTVEPDSVRVRPSEGDRRKHERPL
jgi:hypothetical protein